MVDERRFSNSLRKRGKGNRPWTGQGVDTSSSTVSSKGKRGGESPWVSFSVRKREGRSVNQKGKNPVRSLRVLNHRKGS